MKSGFAVACFVAFLSSVAGATDFWVENRIVYNTNLPLDRDGLKDDVDYFPDVWLDSVADCGMNGVWMWVEWRKIANTFLTPRTVDGERRLKKLRSIAKKCRDHGLHLWIFGIEPASFKPGDALLKEHPELGGALFKSINWRVWCPSEPKVLRYVEEAAFDLFSNVPELGGFLNIANGEGLSTCIDALWDAPTDKWKEDEDARCARCAAKAPWRLYADVSAAIVRGIRRAGGQQRYISWFYQPICCPERNPWVAECAAHAPEGTTFMYNFESGLLKRDLGRYRCGGDYWLSQSGPGGPFRTMAVAARTADTRIGAKIQTCNSHELATLPYVPVPGILYRKYRAMRDSGVRDVLQGWFFGGDPSCMLHAAGELSRGEPDATEEAFLNRFAGLYWGPALAPFAVRVWRTFSEAFARYPVCNMMEYYGPFHAGIAWPLHADIRMSGMPQTWRPGGAAAGDMIGECLAGYDLDEAECIVAKMAEDVYKMEGLDRLAQIAPETRRKDVGIMKAFRLQVLSAGEIFRFYRLRRDAVSAAERGESERAVKLIGEMKESAVRAKLRTEDMLPLAEKDSRLGFHGEASCRQYDPETLRARLVQLDGTLRRLDEIATDIRAGKTWPRAAREICSLETDMKGDGIIWKVSETVDGDFVFAGRFDVRKGRIALATFDLAASCAPLVTQIDPKKGVLPTSDYVTGNVTLDGIWVSFDIRCRAAQWKHDRALRPRWILFSAVPPDDLRADVALWPDNPRPVTARLALLHEIPECFGYLNDERQDCCSHRLAEGGHAEQKTAKGNLPQLGEVRRLGNGCR